MNKVIADIKRRAGITEDIDHSREIQKLMHQLATYLAEDLKVIRDPGELDARLQAVGNNLEQLVHQKMGV